MSTTTYLDYKDLTPGCTYKDKKGIEYLYLGAINCETVHDYEGSISSHTNFYEHAFIKVTRVTETQFEKYKTFKELLSKTNVYKFLVGHWAPKLIEFSRTIYDKDLYIQAKTKKYKDFYGSIEQYSYKTVKI